MGQIPHHCGFLVSHSSWFLSKFLNSNLLPGHQRLSIVATKPQFLVTTDFYSLLFHNGIVTLKKDTNDFKIYDECINTYEITELIFTCIDENNFTERNKQ